MDGSIGDKLRDFSMRQLAVFVAVYRRRSVTEAAEALHITQPTASKLLAELERISGLTLFTREQGRLTPTMDAENLIEPVEKMLVAKEELKRNFGRVARGQAGHVRVSTLPAFSVGLIPEVADAFLRERPEATADLHTAASTYVIEAVANRVADIGFVTARPTDGRVILSAFAALPAVCVLPADDPLATRTEIWPEDLEGRRFVSLDRQSPFRERLDHVFKEAKVARRIVIEAGDAAMVCKYVSLGNGLTVIDPISALDRWREGNIILRPFQPEVMFEVYSVTPDGTALSTLAEQFLMVAGTVLKALQREIADACQNHA
ncbi:LysR substrate-binding domain-containing protein [Paraburkholderia agricolaris]|jgi:DNA-binding transcriptional LysR family regulator